MSDASNAMFHKSTGGNVKDSELIISGRNTTVQKSYNFAITVFPDIIGYIQIAAQHFVAWTRSADGKERDSVDISTIIPPDPSSLPVSSIADMYTRSMLECLQGYPLYEPRPFSQRSVEYSRNGVNVGDVGFVREDGTFDFLFNICPPRNNSINPPHLPDGFSLETPEHLETRAISPFSSKSIYPRSVTITESSEYICEGSEGAVLELPEGAIQDEAIDKGLFSDLAKRHGVEWYKYTITRGRDISNGSMYLVTSFTKCTQWGIAVFDRACSPGQGLTFVRSPLGWKGARVFTTKVAGPNQGNTPNQCIFLRGYKIMIREDIFKNIRTRQRAQRIRGGGGSTEINFFSKMRSKKPVQATKFSVEKSTAKKPAAEKPAMEKLTMEKPRLERPTKESDKVVLHANFNLSPVHPSDIINAALLNQNPSANIALTHDDVWCDLLRGNFPEPNYETLIGMAQSYTCTIDEYAVLLEKNSGSRNVLDKSGRQFEGAGTSYLEESMQGARDDRNSDISILTQTSVSQRPRSFRDEDNASGSVPSRTQWEKGRKKRMNDASAAVSFEQLNHRESRPRNNNRMNPKEFASMVARTLRLPRIRGKQSGPGMSEGPVQLTTDKANLGKLEAGSRESEILRQEVKTKRMESRARRKELIMEEEARCIEEEAHLWRQEMEKKSKEIERREEEALHLAAEIRQKENDIKRREEELVKREEELEWRNLEGRLEEEREELAYLQKERVLRENERQRWFKKLRVGPITRRDNGISSGIDLFSSPSSEGSSLSFSCFIPSPEFSTSSSKSSSTPSTASFESSSPSSTTSSDSFSPSSTTSSKSSSTTSSKSSSPLTASSPPSFDSPPPFPASSEFSSPSFSTPFPSFDPPHLFP